ncbi:hypothetical protein, partial [Bradyrhizobium sp. NBAIM08]|uniref:hypothetical protein n=1 Tax=Bradyrhizobium sp. NBAIM08 TaxID=2793815 RepID=UPI001CD45ED2
GRIGRCPIIPILSTLRSHNLQINRLQKYGRYANSFEKKSAAFTFMLLVLLTRNRLKPNLLMLMYKTILCFFTL